MAAVCAMAAILNSSRYTWMWRTHPVGPVSRGPKQYKTAKKPFTGIISHSLLKRGLGHRTIGKKLFFSIFHNLLLNAKYYIELWRNRDFEYAAKRKRTRIFHFRKKECIALYYGNHISKVKKKGSDPPPPLALNSD